MTAPPAQPAVGDTIAGRFRLTGEVGKGAMGAVFAAEHVVTGQKVAVKFMIVGDDAGDQEFVKRFEQEAKVMASLRSSNSIRIYDFGRTADGALFMAMELLTGVPLDKRIRELARAGKALGERETLDIAGQILRSLTEAHALGLVHRDLKPGNIFLSDDGSGDVLAKVLDFGIARTANSQLTNVGKVLGTPTYMGPEQWKGAKVTAATDLYSVGCILFCCVAGRPPFLAGDNVMALMHKHCSEPLPDLRALAKVPVSDAFIQIVQTATAKNPADRFIDAKAMRAAVEAAAGGAWAGTPATGAVAVAVAPQQGLRARVEPTEAATMALGRADLQVPRAKSRVPLVVAAVVGLVVLGVAVALWIAKPTKVAVVAAAVPVAAPVPTAVAVPAAPAAVPVAPPIQPVAAPVIAPAVAVPPPVAPVSPPVVALPAAPKATPPTARPAKAEPKKKSAGAVQFVD